MKLALLYTFFGGVTAEGGLRKLQSTVDKPGVGGIGTEGTWTKAQRPSDQDLKVWRQAIYAADTLQTQDASCAYPSSVTQKNAFLTSLGMPYSVSENIEKGIMSYRMSFKDGSQISLSDNMKTSEIKITCYHKSTAPQPHGEEPWAIKLTQDQITASHEAFRKHDSDGNGLITTGGAYSALFSLTDELPEEYMQTLVWYSDGNKDKMIDFAEFLNAYQKALFVEKDYKTFETFDSNHDHTISEEELETALVKAGLGKALVDKVLETYDHNSDGKISFEEYQQLVNDARADKTGDKQRTTVPPATADNALTETDITILQAVYAKFDRNEDHILSAPEYNDLVTQMFNLMRPQKTGMMPKLRRFLQVLDNQPQYGSLDEVMGKVLKGIHRNQNGDVSYVDFQNTFQWLKEHISKADWQKLTKIIVTIEPMDCSKFTTCKTCAAAQNSGLCGWDENYDYYYGKYASSSSSYSWSSWSTYWSSYYSNYYYYSSSSSRSSSESDKRRQLQYYYSGPYGVCVYMDEDLRKDHTDEKMLATQPGQCFGK